MTRVVFIALSVIVVALAAVAWQALRRWDAATSELRRELRSSASRPKSPVYSEAELAGLPPPAARFFRTALRDGQPVIERAHVAWRGEFNFGKPGKDNWKPFTATQDFVPGAPGFVWDARMQMMPGVPVLVRDAVVKGSGSMRGAIFGLLPVVNVQGTPEIAVAALQRYLGEAAWFPTALLPSQGVAWSEIDDSRALATIRSGATAVSLEFRFGADGLIASVFAPDRTYDDGKSPAVPRPWLAGLLNYGERHGIKVPEQAFAEWELPGGRFQYWRGSPTDVRFDFVAPQ